MEKNHSKDNLRKSMLELRSKQSQKSIIQKSEKILANLMALEVYISSKVILVYSGKATEVQTEKLIKHALNDKRVILPITNTKKRILEISEIKDFDLELTPAVFNILEPKKEFYRRTDIDIVDLIVVPGVCFDYKGNRLGYGYGYYDKLLTIVNRPIPFIGLAFEFQLVKNLPNSHHDVPVHIIITEDRVIDCGA